MRQRQDGSRDFRVKVFDHPARLCFPLGAEMAPNHFYALTIPLCLTAVVVAYFFSNPIGHSNWFVTRRFINWLPLGMTYAFLCMGRFNLIVAKSALGPLMSKQDLGIILTAGM